MPAARPPRRTRHESVEHWEAESKEAAAALAVQKHEHWLRSWLANQIVAPHHVLHELRGKNLACWCALGSPCHADTLLRYANPERHNVAIEPRR